MSTTTAEKEWLQRFVNRGEVKKREEEVQAPKPKKKEVAKPCTAVKGNGLDDVAGMTRLKELIVEGFINVLKNRECAEAYGIKPPSLLFYGPAGCGKTFFAEKIAEELGINFMKVIPDDLASSLIHGTQQKIGEVFRKAEMNAPTLVFFDEFETMVPKRSENEVNQSYNGEVNEFLCMLNNASERGVYVLAATNHPECIDRAVLRTGRIDELIYVDMPDMEARENLFRLALSKLPAEENIDCKALAAITEGFNCSDINYIVKLASRKMFNATVKKGGDNYCKITQSVLEETVSLRSPSVTHQEIRQFERMRNEFSPKDKNKKDVRIGFHI